MAITHGKAGSVLVGANDLSQWCTKAEPPTSFDEADATTFGATGSAKVFLPGLQEGNIALTGLWDGATGALDTLFRAILGAADRAVSLAMAGWAIGNSVVIASAFGKTFKPGGAIGTLITWTGECRPDGPVDYGVSLHSNATAEIASTNSASVDNAAATSNGWAATIHANTVSGTLPSATVKVRDSADNSTFADMAVPCTFTALIAAGSQYLSGTGAVRRYVRCESTISGTLPSFNFAVGFARR